MPFVDNLKIRGSVGKLGNDTGVNAYMFLRTLQATSSDPSVVIGSGSQNAYKTNSLDNPIYNIGFESTLWSGLLGVEFDAFYKITKDILEKQGGTFAPSVGGYYPSVVNTGKADNPDSNWL